MGGVKTIPLEIMATHVAIVGKTGSGKTYTAKGLVERLLEANRRVIVLDPTGAWWGLRSKAAGAVPPAPRSGAAVIQMWKDALGGGAARMLDILVAAYPNTCDRANLADRLNMAASGGTFQTYLSRLKSNGLVAVTGRKIKASEALFQ